MTVTASSEKTSSAQTRRAQASRVGGDARLDGRALRGARNRKHIATAMLELLREGVLRPTAEQVATRAGVGVRTVFRHFDDMDSLYEEINQRVENELAALLAQPAPAGALKNRARAMLVRRAKVYEHIMPFKHADALQRWRSSFLQGTHAKLVQRLRADLLTCLPELAHAEPLRVEAFGVACSFGAWSWLRGEQQLDADESLEVMQQSLTALLRDTF